MRRPLALLAAALTCAPAAAAGQTTERLEQVIWLKPRGEVEVEERHVVRFEAAGVTAVVRNLHTPYPLIAAMVTATTDGKVVSFDGDIGDRDGGVQVHARRGLRQIRWKVAPRAGSVHTFGMSYLLWNAVRQDGRGDYFRWRVSSMSPAGRIENADVRLAFTHPLARPPEIRGGPATVSLGPGNKLLTLVAQRIPQRKTLELILRFEAGTAVGSDLRWQNLRRTRKRRALLVFPAAAAGLLVTFAAHAVRRRRRRD